METDLLTPRQAHRIGFTVLKYKPDGKEIITAGADARICVFKTLELGQLSKPMVINQHSEPIYTIAVHDKYFATASADGKVALFSTRTNEFEKLLTRSSTLVRSIHFNSKGTKLAIGSDDEAIRLISVNNPTDTTSIQGHRAFIKSVAFDPFDEYLLSSGCEGDVRVWDLEADGLPACVKTLTGETTASLSDSSLQATVAWKQGGSSFAFPGKNNDVLIYSKSRWTLVSDLSHEHTGSVVTLAWSPNGRYIASAGQDHRIIVWDAQEKKAIAKHTNLAQVCALAWHPRNNELAFTDMDGQLTVWNDVVPKDYLSVSHPAQVPRKITDKELDRLFGDDDDIGQSTLDPEDQGEDLQTVDDLEDREAEEDGDDMDMDDFVVDDDGAGYTEDAPHRHQRHQRRQPRSSAVESRHVSSRFNMPSGFYPGETPFKRSQPHGQEPREGERRYLAFNLTGIVYTIFQGSHSIVNVEFHDQSFSRNFHFTDYRHFTHASLCEKGVVFSVAGHQKPSAGSESDDDEQAPEERFSPSILHFRPFNSWANNSEWTWDLPEGEDVQHVAVNQNSVTTATSAGYVRIFSLSGIQRHIFRTDNVIAMAASANLVLIVYALGPILNDQQHLDFLLMKTDTFDILQKDKLPMAPQREIKWLGFSETTQPALFDSQGILSVLHQQHRFGQSVWVPMFDSVATAQTRQKTERYWPVGLLKNRLVCVILRGNNEHPFFPLPPVEEIELRLPTLATNNYEADRLEEQYLRMQLQTTEERSVDDSQVLMDESKADLEMDKALLQLIQVACKADKAERALDIASALHLSQSVDAAIKIAMFHHNTRLAERMTSVKEHKFMQDHDLSTHSTTTKRGGIDMSQDDAMTQDSELLSPLPKRTRA